MLFFLLYLKYLFVSLKLKLVRVVECKHEEYFITIVGVRDCSKAFRNLIGGLVLIVYLHNNIVVNSASITNVI